MEQLDAAQRGLPENPALLRQVGDAIDAVEFTPIDAEKSGLLVLAASEVELQHGVYPGVVESVSGCIGSRL
jgi:hypothetical protein